MNDLETIARRLKTVTNLRKFGRNNGLSYRTLQRLKHGHSGSPKLTTYRAVMDGLDRAGA